MQAKDRNQDLLLAPVSERVGTIVPDRKRAFSSLKGDCLKGDFIIAYTYPHMKASIRVLGKNRFLLKGPCPKRE
ncbi:hypothetical protein MSSAC_2248 [Methanosarcina siciliae C2J]|uniref:Uncharacterized protein n=1 Tax=Methanosarcina siciliae C2J TaxID=1434118 RepID=A0A0E3PNX1_9EURY|nr:hypothetical protein [Methanosarcina siciliae]AKB36838.1 hypothetical protein MSSAC_2248 [Methanosarcina siciliae C2J]